MMNRYNLPVMIRLIATITLISLYGCKTSGDIRAEKMSKDPGEIRTVTAPPGALPSVGNVNEEIARELEKTRGLVQEQVYLRNQEQTQSQATIARLERERAQLIEEIQILKGTESPNAARGADLLWTTAEKDLKSKNYSEAAMAYKEFIENFPQDLRSDEALIKRAQSEYASDQFKTALVTFDTYLSKFPKGSRRAMAWLGQGAALIRLKQKKDAKLFLEQCIELFPKSKEARIARKLLKNPNTVPPVLFI